ncbi:helix-turn-helix transcriptional regulator [Actinomadura rupiterrae]|uniref:helix-turn-helix transcriptional regulator n=1 Tax=Actinomadura rupiterrae TaxID=559627 RepID=UPI0020A2A744|nr:helix-turn-helix domain-containing protein [Actinomadura rupiterrae]MCP2336368.1 DNA-binding CsgD family transcriptional regulator [Actinomadura rupiterrae]
MSSNVDQNVVLRGERELVERATPLFAGAREEFVCAAAHPRTWALPGAREQIVAARRGHPDVKAYKLYGSEALADDSAVRLLTDLAGRGPRVRILDGPIPHETIVVDRRVAVIAGPLASGEREFTVVRTPAVVAGILALFWSTWRAATEVSELTAPAPALGEQSRDILALLAEGMKDEAACRRLGISLRTYRRRVAELMELLDAESRFQAGLRARSLGLVP